MSDYQPEWPPPDKSTQDPSAAELPDYWSKEIYDEFMANPSAFAAGQPSHGVARYSPLQPPEPTTAGWPHVSEYRGDGIDAGFIASAAGPPSHDVAHYSQLQPPAPAPTEQRESENTRKYDEWLATPKDKRPPPTRKVIAGFVERTLDRYVEPNRTREGYVRAFETAEGIPLGTLKRCVAEKGGSVTGIGLQEKKDWEPETYTAPEHLNKGTLACIAMMYGGKSPKEAYKPWKALAPHLRPAPNLKIVLGWADKKRINSMTVGEFAQCHTIPREDTRYTLGRDGRVASVTVVPWPPPTYGVPSQSQQPTNTATATNTNWPYGNTPSLSQAGGPSCPAAAWQSSGSALGPRHGL